MRDLEELNKISKITIFCVETFDLEMNSWHKMGHFSYCDTELLQEVYTFQDKIHSKKYL